MFYYLKQINSVRDILPVLMVILTRHDRMRVDIEWSDRLWTHNIFRVYEMIFWRRTGIRPEMTACVEPDGRTAQYAHTFEAGCALVETHIRQMFSFRFRMPVKVWIPMMATPQGYHIPASPFLFAIAFDTVAGVAIDNTQSSQTYSLTTSGSDRLLASTAWIRTSEHSLSDVTYNSVSLTAIASSQNYLNSDTNYLRYLIAPTIGANNLVQTYSGTGYAAGIATSYTGMKQSSQPDSTPVTDPGDGSSNNFSLTVTTVADNAWMVGCWQPLDGTCSAGANTAMRGTFNSQQGDNGTAQTPAGSHSMNMTGCGNRVAAKIAVSFAPSVAAGPTNMKTYNTNAIANVKTMNTNPIANVKTFDTNA